MKPPPSSSTTNPRQRSGQSCICGKRIYMADVLQLFAAGKRLEKL